jgi:hypothetical protein
MIKKIMKVFLRTVKRKKTWKDIEYFDERWMERIEKMSKFIDVSESVMDLGCGKMWLQSFLDKSTAYYPVDYVKRSENTIVADFNKKEFPSLNVDVVFASGVLEYIDDPDWFVKQISACSNKCILSYCTMDYFPDIKIRKSAKWVNNLFFKDIENLFNKNNMILDKHLLHSVTNANYNYVLFVFKKTIIS